MRLVLVVTVAFALLHIAAVWGRVDVYMWRDAGRWLHEVERFSAGELPYRDFGWQFPPLALWLLGAWARLVGTGVNAIWIATSALYVLICVQFVDYTRRLVVPAAVLPVVIAGLLLSAAYANYQSAPLPLGMYMPAAPLGFLLLLTATLATFDALESGGARAALLGGVASGLAILTKQDFWIPALYLVTTTVTVLARRPEPGSSRAAVLLVGGFLFTLLAAGVPIVATAGWNALPDILTGFGSASIFLGRGLPTWERMAADFNALLILGLLAGTVLITARQIRGTWSRWLVGLLAAGAAFAFAAHTILDHALKVGGEASNLAALRADRSALGSTATDTATELMLHALPVALPVVVALLLMWRRNHIEDRSRMQRLAFILGLCIAARVRRGFEYVEWYHFLLELPIYVLAFELLVPWRMPVRRSVMAAATAGAIGFGVFAYWYFGVGFMTRRNAHELLRTTKGNVWVEPPIARQYHELDAALRRADPTGERPLLVFGYASFNYFLDRRNPSASTAGLRFTPDPAGSIAAALRQVPLVLDNLYFTRGMLPVPRLELGSWRQPLQPSFYRTYDRPLFERVLAECNHPVATVTDLLDRPMYRLYDCARSR